MWSIFLFQLFPIFIYISKWWMRLSLTPIKVQWRQHRGQLHTLHSKWEKNFFHDWKYLLSSIFFLLSIIFPEKEKNHSSYNKNLYKSIHLTYTKYIPRFTGRYLLFILYYHTQKYSGFHFSRLFIKLIFEYRKID